MRHPLRLLALALVGGAFAFCAATARADGGLLGLVSTTLGANNCGATASVFSPWGDPSQYYFASDGGFENGGAGWTFGGGARVVSGNEPFYLHSSSDRRSVLIPSGGSITSPALCFGSNMPGIRLMATSPTGSASLHVRVIARGLLGILSILDGGTVQVGPGWSPTIDFGTTFSQLNTTLLGAKSIQVVLTASNGSVQVDDLYVDPFLQW